MYFENGSINKIKQNKGSLVISGTEKKSVLERVSIGVSPSVLARVKNKIGSETGKTPCMTLGKTFSETLGETHIEILSKTPGKTFSKTSGKTSNKTSGETAGTTSGPPTRFLARLLEKPLARITEWRN